MKKLVVIGSAALAAALILYYGYILAWIVALEKEEKNLGRYQYRDRGGI